MEVKNPYIMLSENGIEDDNSLIFHRFELVFISFSLVIIILFSQNHTQFEFKKEKVNTE